jgi:O2-independent ubiquinone biosynthesis accessory factor UbiT
MGVPSAMTLHPPPLDAVRRLIDCVDDAMLLMLAARRHLAGQAARIKRGAGLPLSDPLREARVRRRARRLSAALQLPVSSAASLADLLILDARQLQGLTARYPDPTRNPLMNADMLPADTGPAAPFPPRWLARLPPPRRLAPLLRCVPASLQCSVLDRVLRQVMARPLAGGALAAIDGRRLGISVDDLGLGWVLQPADGTIEVAGDLDRAEATVHGSLTDLMLLASRLEDADTLFFQRRLQLTGDVELGLTARNLLDQLPWEEVPLAARILLHRAARFARMARAAHRGERLDEG